MGVIDKAAGVQATILDEITSGVRVDKGDGKESRKETKSDEERVKGGKRTYIKPTRALSLCLWLEQ